MNSIRMMELRTTIPESAITPIIAVALKNRMRFDVKNNVQIPGRPAAQPGLAIAGRTEARTSINARRHTEFDFRGAVTTAGPAARTARFFDDAPRALALWAGLGNAEDSARADDLAATAASRTGPRLGAGFCA